MYLLFSINLCFVCMLSLVTKINQKLLKKCMYCTFMSFLVYVWALSFQPLKCYCISDFQFSRFGKNFKLFINTNIWSWYLTSFNNILSVRCHTSAMFSKRSVVLSLRLIWDQLETQLGHRTSELLFIFLRSNGLNPAKECFHFINFDIRRRLSSRSNFRLSIWGQSGGTVCHLWQFVNMTHYIVFLEFTNSAILQWSSKVALINMEVCNQRL